MQLYSLRSSVLVIFLWLNGSGECLPGQGKVRDVDLINKSLGSSAHTQFRIYKHCMEKKLVPTWKLLSPTHNGSFYISLNFRFNTLIEKAFPIAIITPTDVPDVRAAVECGVTTGIRLLPISGGHSYAGLSYGSNDSIVIDFQYMSAISINNKKKTVTVGPGALISQLYSELWKTGKLGAALGVCATVAMGGLAITGGVGYFSQLYGLVIDNILEMNMVDASGNSVLVDPNHNVDLWWAMRGIGPGYIGLVTSVKLKVFRADDLKLVFVKIRYHNRSFKSVMGSYIKWLEWARKHDPSIASVIVITRDKRENTHDSTWHGIEVQLLQVGDPRIKGTGNEAFINVSQNIFPKSVDYNVTRPTFADFVLNNNHTTKNRTKWISDTDTESRFRFLSDITKDKATPHHFYAKSFYVKKRYHADDLRRAEKVLLEMPNDSCGVWINSEQGAISNHPLDESSFVHRNALFNFKMFHRSHNDDHVAPSQKWIKKFYRSLQFLDSGETYQGYPERDLSDHLHRYYGSNLNRLIEIKKKWDPDGYFKSEQSIPIH